MKTRTLSILGFAALLGLAVSPAYSENAATAAAKENQVNPAARISLLGAKGPVGWVFLVKPSANASGELWQVHGDEWRFPAGLTGYLRTEKSFSHYRLHVEWTYLEKLGNSGIFVAENEHDALWPHSYQINLKTGSAGDLLAQGDLKFSDGSKTLTKKKPAAEKPVGEWNTSDITCDGHAITVVINGVAQNELADAPHTDGCVALQLEGAAIAFRNVWIEPLDQRP
jgi:hypothetical protein